MSQLDNIVDITITTAPAPISQQSFGVPLILGSSTPGWSDLVRSYDEPDALLSDGYVSGDPEYQAALAAFSGNIVPPSFLVGRRTNSDAAQVDTFEPVSTTVTAGAIYAFTLDGIVCSYTAQVSDTLQTVVGALSSQATAVGGVACVISNDGSNKVLTITGSVTGVAHTYTAVSATLTHIAVTQPSGIANDLQAISAVNTAWYGLLTPSATSLDVQQAAPYVEAAKKIYIATNSSTSNFDPTSTSSLAYLLHAKGYTRTALIPSIASASTFIDAAWMGYNIAAAPGSNTWAFSSLPGQQFDALTDNQVSGALGKNANVFINVAGANITRSGTMASGDFIDSIIGKDWLHSTIQQNVFNIIRAASASGSKIPYTNKGASRIGQGVYAGIRSAIESGFVDGDQAYTVAITRVEDTPAAQRALRQCPPISFECFEAGAVQSASITGVLDI
jgi:Protein of unknown function (DUF3383)